MAITTLDNVIKNLQVPIFMTKSVQAASGVWSSQWYTAGFPGAGQPPPAGLAGVVLSGTVTGQIPFTNPQTGQNTYIARWEVTPNATSLGTLMICDRLWHNTGITVTSTAVQTINSPQFPPRDATGGTSGHGIMIGAEVAIVMGAGTPTFTMNYTGNDGTTATTVTEAMVTTMPAGSFIPIALAAGHTGVQKVNWWQQSATMTSGAYSLVAYRAISTADCIRSNFPSVQDAIELGMPKIYDNSVLFFILKSSQTTGNGLFLTKLTYAQG